MLLLTSLPVTGPSEVAPFCVWYCFLLGNSLQSPRRTALERYGWVAEVHVQSPAEGKVQQEHRDPDRPQRGGEFWLRVDATIRLTVDIRLV